MINWLTRTQKTSLSWSVLSLIAISAWASPSWAGDPFRRTNPRPIGDKTEAAFIAIFRQGNYKQAQVYLLEATKVEADEPLAHAMQSSLAYSDGNLDQMKASADKTLATAQKLVSKDPLRGNLYVAVGLFLQGAYTYKTQGPLGAIDKLQKVFDHLELAEKNSPNDPEFNLLKGYLDLILSVNLPFSKPEDAIARFEKYAAPDYMVDRALSSAYRDLKQYDKALDFMNKALVISPDNPELQYLKGQLLRKQGKNNKNMALLKESYTYFEQAMKKVDQLPKEVQIPLRHDHQAVQQEIEKLAANPTLDKF